MGRLYRLDTGEDLDPSIYGFAPYRPIEQSQPEDESGGFLSGLGDTISNAAGFTGDAILSGMAGFGKSIYGLGRAAEDAGLGIPFVDLPTDANTATAFYDDVAEEAANRHDLSSPLASGTFNGIAGVTQMAPLLPFGPGATAIGSGLEAAGSKYDEYRDEGVDPLEAGAGAASTGLMTAATQYIPLEQYFKPGASFLSRAYRGAAAGVPLGLANEAFNQANDYIVAGQQMSLPDRGRRFLDNAVSSVVTAPILAGAGKLSERMGGRPIDADTVDESTIRENPQDLPTALAAPEPVVEAPVDTSPIDAQFTKGPIALDGEPSPLQLETKIRLLGKEKALPAPDGKIADGSLNADGAVIKAPLTEEAVAKAGKELKQAAKEIQAFEKDRISSKNTPAKLEENKAIQAEVDKWSGDWINQPEMVAKANAWIEYKAEKSKVKADTKKKYAAFLKSQKGAIRNPFPKEEIPINDEKEKLPGERFYGNNFSLTDLMHGDPEQLREAFKAVRGQYRDKFIFPKTEAEMFEKQGVPEPMAMYQAANGRDEYLMRTSRQLHDMMLPYWKAEDNTRVNSVLESLRRKRTGKAATPESLAAIKFKDGSSLTPDEIERAMAVRNTMDTALDHLIDHDIHMKSFILGDEQLGKYKAIMDGIRDDFKKNNYIPFSRFGDFTVKVKDAEGNTHHFEMFDSKKERDAKFRELHKQFPKEKGFTVSASKVNKESLQGYENLPPDILHKLAQAEMQAGITGDAANIFSQVSGGEDPIKGFKKHLVGAGLVKGNSQDFKRSISDYIASLSTHLANKSFLHETRDLVRQLDDRGERKLAKRMQDYGGYIAGGKDEMNALRGALFHYYLGFNPKAAAVNLTQMATTTLPQLTTLTPHATREWGKALNQTRQYLTNKDLFAKNQPQLSVALKDALESGYIDEQVRQALGRMRKGGGDGGFTEKMLDASGAMFSGAEKLNRIHAFIASYNNAPKGLDEPRKIAFAKKFVSDTQFEYGKRNRPKIARGPIGAVAGMFRLWPGNWLRLLRNNLEASQYQAAAGQALAMGLLGGATSFPFIRELMRAMEASGEDPKKIVRQGFGENQWLADLFLHGGPYKGGLDISSSIAFGDMLPNIEQGFAPGVLKALMGVAYDPIASFSKAADFTKKGKTIQALEAVAPRGSVRPLLKAYRFATEGPLANDGTNLIGLGTNGERTKATPAEIAMIAGNFNPSTVSKGYEIKHSADIAEARSNSASAGYNQRAADIIMKYGADSPQFADFRKQIDEHNANATPIDYIQLNPPTIKEIIMKATDPVQATLRSLPKKARGDFVETLKVHKGEASGR